LPGILGAALLASSPAGPSAAANFIGNVRALGVRRFHFLRGEAGFEIAQALIPFVRSSRDAVIVAPLNTRSWSRWRAFGTFLGIASPSAG
jgi:ABC-type amino acid transport system permease subunit